MQTRSVEIELSKYFLDFDEPSGKKAGVIFAIGRGSRADAREFLSVAPDCPVAVFVHCPHIIPSNGREEISLMRQRHV